MSEGNGNDGVSEIIKRARLSKDGVENFRKWAATGGIYAIFPLVLWAHSQLESKIDERVKSCAVTKSELKEITAAQAELDRELLSELKRLHASLSALDKRTAVLSAVIGQKIIE